MPNLSQLLQPRSRDAVLADLISILQTRGYPPTDWVEGSVQRTLIELVAAGLADLEALRLEIAKGGFLDLASGDYLDLLARSAYALERKQATFARQTFRLTAAPGFGPYSIQPAQLWAGNAAGLRFNNTAGGTLPLGGTLDLEFKAESPGAAYNLPLNTGTLLFTPLPGVTVSNIGVVEAAIDRETDAAFRTRCRLRWAEIGLGATRAAYESWALASTPSITKVRILDNNPRGQGTVDVVVWGEGGLGAGAVAQVNSYIQQRKPLTSNVEVYAATQVSIGVTATIRLRAGFLAAVQAAVASRLADFQRGLAIGATVYRSALIEALFVPNVVDVALSAPAADTSLGPTQVATFTLTPTWLEV
ncbi:Baseplate J family protein [Allomeiothermus silvanus DSM 9946]|uniref:Baseplate J family protein n=1 Tax=Allomeiothermus silvanus (strain ATCC 700542 / DSM 9946 / NBRC 106475 / NCIMB 13440 / VI-R2) TaxID=526227 RepID=D7BGI8_ALLS1|nr:baseplate J/gp47 family protein [Allomeiothermus silvanus]ADH63804.1 Baseplate J family protein [Allomeiothermus silvanus DSM 9946]